jgi:hypothetical protein
LDFPEDSFDYLMEKTTLQPFTPIHCWIFFSLPDKPLTDQVAFRITDTDGVHTVVVTGLPVQGGDEVRMAKIKVLGTARDITAIPRIPYRGTE